MPSPPPTDVKCAHVPEPEGQGTAASPGPEAPDSTASLQAPACPPGPRVGAGTVAGPPTSPSRLVFLHVTKLTALVRYCNAFPKELSRTYDENTFYE